MQPPREKRAAKRDMLVKGMRYSGFLNNSKSWNFEFILINVVGTVCTVGLSSTLVKYYYFYFLFLKKNTSCFLMERLHTPNYVFLM